MKRIFLFILMFLVLAAGVCLADPSPSPSPAAIATAGQTFLQVVVGWISAHQMALGGLIAAIIDFVWTINPKAQSNGPLHWIYLFARKKAGMPDPAAPPQ